MATNIPVTHVFSEINLGKYKTVKHYELLSVENGNSQLSTQINLSKNRNYARSMPDYWLKIKSGHKWSSCITGLFKTDYKNLYKGDVDNKNHLLLFKFSNEASNITIYYYKNYFTKDLSHIIKFVNS